MKKQARKRPTTQAPTIDLSQALRPMVRGLRETKRAFEAMVMACGHAAVEALLRDEAAALVGPKHQKQAGRRYHHWGTTATELPLAGRRVKVKRARVRTVDGDEVPLPSLAVLQAEDALTDRAVQQILVGVSTRDFDASLPELPAAMPARGASKSAVSRQVIKGAKARMQQLMTRPLDDLDLGAMFLDGIQVASRAVIVVLGVTRDGTKVPLGLRLGSTENHTVCTELLHELLARKLRLDRRILCVIDGGKGIRKALTDVLGDNAVIQRCQLHKQRNVLEHLPRVTQPYVRRQLCDAYRSSTAKLARQRLQQLMSWLGRKGEDAAAASLREGLEETLTVLKLGLAGTLARAFATTNAIENVMGSIRRTTRNVKRWRNGAMITRWVALAIDAAAARFRKIKGYRKLDQLVQALNSSRPLDADAKAA